ncbi:MAG: 16S rRNA (adenine(1518)-N(6)/adenine(1519)-N(6))-dimethyltransferase RsmA [Actinobacteria bacterium]|nr:16S rRNA (adenine(1518)-N(6)/adenine(1519)-N(6))-dimethyltransferase RsmA [Actinomycetota bacterium]
MPGGRFRGWLRHDDDGLRPPPHRGACGGHHRGRARLCKRRRFVRLTIHRHRSADHGRKHHHLDAARRCGGRRATRRRFLQTCQPRWSARPTAHRHRTDCISGPRRNEPRQWQGQLRAFSRLQLGHLLRLDRPTRCRGDDRESEQRKVAALLEHLRRHASVGCRRRHPHTAVSADRKPGRRTASRHGELVTLSRPQAAALLEQHGLSPRRTLGQNFVVDPNTVRRIARLAGVSAGDVVVEIGAGLGSLTAALAETGARVAAVEVDRGIVPVLRAQMVDHPNVEVHEADAMQLDWIAFITDLNAHLDRARGAGVTVVANLPYNIATPLVADLLDRVPQVRGMLVMVQAEVGERFCAKPGTPAYGAVSLKVAYWAHAEIVGRVPPTVFLPRPKVDSVLVRIARYDTPAADVDDAEALFSLVRTGFAKRRKMLRTALAGTVTADQFERAGVDPTARAEQLTLGDWAVLCRTVHT